MGRQVALRFAARVPILLVSICYLAVGASVSCNDSAQNIQVDVPKAVSHHAWVGEGENGRSFVLEALAPPQDSTNARFSEESMLRERLRLSESSTLLRLHLFGLPSDLQQPGEVKVGDASFQVFDSWPKDLPVNDRLLWNSVLRGLPAPSPEGLIPLHRSFLVHSEAGAAAAEEATAVWSSDEIQVPLQPRVWTENDRGQYFQKATLPHPPQDG